MEYKNELERTDRGSCPHYCEGCQKECSFYTGVSLPVEIEPDAKVGPIEVECCGDPVIKSDCRHDKLHKIVITQKFFIKIPICYEVNTHVGDSEINCKAD